MIRSLLLNNISKIKLDSIHYPVKKFTARPSLLRTLSSSAPSPSSSSSKKKPEPEQEQGGSNNFLVWTVGALAAAGVGYYYFNQKGQLKSSTEPLDYQKVYNSIAELLTSDPDYDVCCLDFLRLT
jgi:hypothetical protein